MGCILFGAGRRKGFESEAAAACTCHVRQSLIENCVTVEVVRCVGSLEQGSPAFLHLSMKPDQNS